MVVGYGSGQAQERPDNGRRGEMFARMKQARADALQDRIAMLQTALRCVNGAADHEQMRACEQQEHQAMESKRQQQKAQMEAMRPAGGNAGGPGGQLR
jgi:hypothetical protein